MPATKPARLPGTSSPRTPRAARENGREPTYGNGTRKPQGPGAPAPRSADARRAPNALVRAWRVVKSIYYASAPSWQVLKSGALLFFGFFCWSSANLLLSYQPNWTVLYYVMAYGFLLTWYGPLTHLALVPHLIPWLRRRPHGSVLHRVGKQLTPISLTLFFSAVLLMGAFPPDVMRVDFQSIAAGERTADVNPTLTCMHEAATIACRLDDAAGVGSITVESGGRELLTRSADDLAFSVDEGDLVEVVGRREFQVIVYTPEGEEARRFTRSVTGVRAR